jgi:hypothetical protein
MEMITGFRAVIIICSIRTVSEAVAREDRGTNKVPRRAKVNNAEVIIMLLICCLLLDWDDKRSWLRAATVLVGRLEEMFKVFSYSERGAGKARGA